MIKGFLICLVLSLIFGFAITWFRQATGKQKLALADTIGFAVLCCGWSVLLLFWIVKLF